MGKFQAISSVKFWTSLDKMVADSEIVIDRPKGSRHPRQESIVYPFDYGYLSGTSAADGDGIDVWVGSLAVEQRVVGVLITVDLFKKDAEIKILLGCTETELIEALETSNNGGQSAILVRRKFN